MFEIQKNQVGRGIERENKMLGVVNAFSKTKSGAGSGDAGRGGGTATARKDREEQDRDLLIGQGGRDFGDVDGEFHSRALTVLN
jgi:hypothetical protein